MCVRGGYAGAEPFRAAGKNSGHTYTFVTNRIKTTRKKHKEQNIRKAEYATSETNNVREKLRKKERSKNNTT